MKANHYFLIFITAGFLFFSACHKLHFSVDSSYTPNLIKNPSFEEDGQPSLKDWYVQDSSEIAFSNDTPEGGGKWSIYMHVQWYGPLPTSPSYYLPLEPGKHIFKFSIYGKSTMSRGAAYIILQKDGNREILAKNAITTTSWQQYTTTDTLNIADGDSVFILLYGGGTEAADGLTYFDSIELEPLDGE